MWISNSTSHITHNLKYAFMWYTWNIWKIFEKAISFQELDISKNKVKEISSDFLEKASNLTILNIQGNKLAVLPSSLQRFSLGEINVGGNPLECSCDLLWLPKWIQAFVANISVPSNQSVDVHGSTEKDGKAKKKKKGLFPVSRPTLFFGADPKLFFQLSKENQKKKRKKMAKKSSKSVERFKSYKQLKK